MSKNPYAGIKFRTQVATEVKLPGSSEYAVGRNGELNASNKKDLLQQIARLMEVSQTSELITEDKAKQRQELAKVHREMVQAAFASPKAHKEVGETLAQELYITSNREGFMRRFFVRQDLAQGQFPQVRMRRKDVVAVVASGPSVANAQIVRDNLYTPPEFYIEARPFVEQRDINQNLGDVLEEKYIEALEGIMVQEDRTWYNQANLTINISNPLTTIVGTMTAAALAALRVQVARWNIPANMWLFANDLWADVIGDASFANTIDPFSKHELLLTGQLGVIFGLTAITDAFRHPEHKVLSQGEMFIVGDPINHGQYTDRGGVESMPIDGTHERVPGRGWWMHESMSMVIANARSVAKATRV